jgi:hypothetical protein
MYLSPKAIRFIIKALEHYQIKWPDGQKYIDLHWAHAF